MAGIGLPRKIALVEYRAVRYLLGSMNALHKYFGSRRFKFGVFVVVGLYLASYLLLSLSGHYQDNGTSVEKLGIYCWIISDRDEWQAKSVIVTTWPHSHSLFANPQGYFFLPAVFLDRLLIHRTQFVNYDAA